jgi:uncharacterized protein
LNTDAFAAFEWDEAKRSQNVVKHGIDFLEAAVALKGSRLEMPSLRNGELRTLAVCSGRTKLISVVYLSRNGVCRIISARAARKNEQREYRQIYG